jgi:hypothetical protein
VLEYQEREEQIRKQAQELEEMSQAMARDRIKQKQQAVIEQNRLEQMLKKAASPKHGEFHITAEMEMRLSPDKLRSNSVPTLNVEHKKELGMQDSPRKLRVKVEPKVEPKVESKEPKGHRRYDSQEL